MKLIVTCLLALWIGLLPAQASFSRSAFYQAMMSNNLEEINQELDGKEKFRGKEAFSAALLMKKSGLVSSAAEKMRLFNEGKSDLEAAIHKDSSNAEYRFLRLMIQEHAPALTHYSSQTRADASFLARVYPHLPEVLQKLIADYSKHSDALKPDDLKKTGL